MSLSQTVNNYLCQAHVEYDLVSHDYANTAMEAARRARLPAGAVVKAVVLKDRMDGRAVMAVLPANRRLRINAMNQALNRDLMFADETELARWFPDCELGAIPPFAQAFDMEMVWDDALAGQEELYLEAGDHQALVHLHGDQFRTLFGHRPHASISIPMSDVLH